MDSRVPTIVIKCEFFHLRFYGYYRTLCLVMKPMKTETIVINTTSRTEDSTKTNDTYILHKSNPHDGEIVVEFVPDTGFLGPFPSGLRMSLVALANIPR